MHHLRSPSRNHNMQQPNEPGHGMEHPPASMVRYIYQDKEAVWPCKCESCPYTSKGLQTFVRKIAESKVLCDSDPSNHGPQSLWTTYSEWRVQRQLDWDRCATTTNAQRISQYALDITTKVAICVSDWMSTDQLTPTWFETRTILCGGAQVTQGQPPARGCHPAEGARPTSD